MDGRHRRRLDRRAMLSVIVAAAVGCTTTAPATAPATSPAASSLEGAAELGIDWDRASSVERPANFQETVSPSYAGAHPILRIAGQALMTDVVRLADGALVAVGYAPPDFQPVAWTSGDADSWKLHSIATTTFTFPVALSQGRDGTVVAVGWSGKRPAAWTADRGGAAWQLRSVPVLGDAGVAERITAVAHGRAGFVAGGSVGPELGDRHARFWRSADGIAWETVPDDPVAFANAEVRSITAFEDGFVAVGVVGTAQERTHAVAWTSPDGERWNRVDDPAFDGGEAVSVVPAPFGGLVAVGSQLDRRMALAWTSPDGRHWTRAPSEPSREHSGGYARMADVVAIGDVAIAVGIIQGLQRGTAMSWVSRDGLTWRRSHRSPVQEQGEFYAVAAGGPGAVVVGSFGAPDSYVPTVWVSPRQ